MQLKRKLGLLQKVAFELRYRRGYSYLDKCGRTIDALMTQQNEWVLKDDSVSPQNAPLLSLRNQAALNFSSKKLDLGLEMRPGGDPLTTEDVSLFQEEPKVLEFKGFIESALETFTSKLTQATQ